MTSHPLGPDAPRDDYLGLAFGGLAFGVSLAVGLSAVVGFVVRTIQASQPPATALTLDDPVALTLFLGTLAACFTAAIATWLVLSPIRNGYRQGMFAMVSFFASFMASLLSMAADRLGGRAALVALGLTAFAAAAWIHRRLRAPAP